MYFILPQLQKYSETALKQILVSFIIWYKKMDGKTTK